jgi:hypothetical protein
MFAFRDATVTRLGLEMITHTNHAGVARRDEEKSRAKERIFSFRDANHRWEPRGQCPDRHG